MKSKRPRRLTHRTIYMKPTCQECFNELNSHGWCESCEKIQEQQDRDLQVLDEKSVKRLIDTNRYAKPYNRKLDQFALYFLKKDVWTIPQLRDEMLEAEINIRRMLERVIKVGLVEKIRCPCGVNFLYRKLEKKCPDCDLMMPAWAAICGGCYDKKSGKIRKKKKK